MKKISLQRSNMEMMKKGVIFWCVEMEKKDFFPPPEGKFAFFGKWIFENFW